MKSIQILMRIIPHRKQRYDTCGDYWQDPLNRTIVNFRISWFKDKRYPILIFLHEIIEFFICRLRGVSLKAIDKFDMEYEKQREICERERAAHARQEVKLPLRTIKTFELAPCGCKLKEEPGDDVHAPYYEAHQVATACEKLIARGLGVKWKEYNDAVENL